MKRQQIGNITIDTHIYWSGGKPSHELRKNETCLYAKINLAQSYANIRKTDREIQHHYDEIDMYFTCLQAVEIFTEQPKNLEMAGIIIGNMILERKFSNLFATIDERNANLSLLIDEMRSRTLADVRETNENPDFFYWWQETIIDLHCYGSTDTSVISLNGLSGAESTYDMLSSSFVESGTYWDYLVTNVQPSEDNLIVIGKKLKHNAFMNWYQSMETNCTRMSLMDNARQGIIDTTELTPDEFLYCIQNPTTDGLGTPAAVAVKVTVSTIIGWILTAMATIAPIVVALIAVDPKKAADNAQSQPDPTTIGDNALNPADWTKDRWVQDPNTGKWVNQSTGEVSDTPPSDTSLALPIMAGGGTLALMLLLTSGISSAAPAPPKKRKNTKNK